MTSTPPTPAERFDAMADSYDQSGVDFFTPLGARLAAVLDAQPGERALDVGCGRGAVTLPLARAVGPDGSVTAVDVSPVMVEHTRAALAAAGLTNTDTRVTDAANLADPDGFDVVAASLVLFFLPDPLAALTSWVGVLRGSGGRIGLTTFGELDETSRALDALFDPWLPPGLLDPRTVGTRGPFASDEGMSELMRQAGAAGVDSWTEPMTLEISGVEAWHRFSMSTGQRAMWQHVPPDERPALLDRAAAILAAGGGGGPATLSWRLRFTLGRPA